MVKRYVLDTMNSGASMEVVDKYTADNATQYVLASDYDALEAALRRHREVIARCVTAGVLRHDLNVFLAAEADVLGSDLETNVKPEYPYQQPSNAPVMSISNSPPLCPTCGEPFLSIPRMGLGHICNAAKTGVERG